MLTSEFYKTMLESMYEGIYFVDKTRKITFWNKGAEKITGFKAKDMLGMHCYDNILNHVDEFGTKLCLQGCPLHKTIEDGQMREVSVYLHHRNGHRVNVLARTMPIFENGEIFGSVEVFNQVKNDTHDLHGDGRQYSVEELKMLALYDQLTMLPNRKHTETFMAAKLTEYQQFDIPFGVAFMDIDNFRDFNNQYGHDLGDEVLKMVAKTYSNATRNTDLIGRWGGEEFIAVFTGVNEQQFAILCEKIRMLVQASVIRKETHEHCVTVSIGGALARPNDDIDSIVKRADENMYISKQNGKNRVTIK